LRCWLSYWINKSTNQQINKSTKYYQHLEADIFSHFLKTYASLAITLQKIIHMKARLFRLLKNKYFFTLVAFAVWMLMFDQNKYDNQMRLQSSLKKLEAQKAFFISEIEQNKKMSEALLSDTALMEKYAREKYLMKRPDEVVYVVVPVKN